MLNKVFRCVVFLVLFGQTSSVLAQKKYSIDSEKSEIRFEVSHLGFLTVEGTFQEFYGEIITRNTIDSLFVDVKSSSIWTNNESRDNTLREEAYLDVKKYPCIRFRAKKTVPDLDETSLTGSLTIKNSTQTLEIPYRHTLNEDEGSVTLKAKASIYRTDYELGLGAMDNLVGNEIKLDITLFAFLIKE